MKIYRDVRIRELLLELNRLKNECDKDAGDDWYTASQRSIYSDVAEHLGRACMELQNLIHLIRQEAK